MAKSVYRVTCNICKRDPEQLKEVVYIGTSGTTLHRRQVEHMDAIRRGQISNALAKHQGEKHPDEPQAFTAEPIQGGIPYNVERFILEALKIQEFSQSNTHQILNQRGEWGHRGLTRLRITTE